MSGFVPNWRAGAEGMLDFPGINGWVLSGVNPVG